MVTWDVECVSCFWVLGVRCGLVGCRLDVGFDCPRVCGLMMGRVLRFWFLGF